ncbi:alpha/beta fold hydrolase [Longispora sp. K20-0274]|uniref:alpha/beta hydrolase family protein n=1 Tax=Longispora sp. K20-0274 TaxID=3088255 RepID=UPI00399BC4D3
MRFLFDDESFSFETLRTAGFGYYGGADLGEVLVTAREIPEGDEDAWYDRWRATAARVHALADEALAGGHRVSAREALLRASNYYRTAEFYLRDDPFSDPRAKELSALSRDTFATAAGLFDTPVRAVAVPYGDTTLPGFLFLVDDSGAPRPTVVFTSGFDSTLEEAWFAVGAAAVRRGYNCLAYDGPGQGAALREQRLTFRHDWEAVLTPVVDYALTRPEIDPDRIAVMGYSLGGFLVARAAAFEPRIAALVLDGGLYDYHDANIRKLPPFLADWVLSSRDDLAEPVIALMTTVNTGVRWALRNGIWTFGASSASDYLRRTRDWTLAGIADRIGCPTLVFDPENEHFFPGEPRRVYDALTCPKTLVHFPEAEGGGEHCSFGAGGMLHQRMFDWLDTTLPGPR